MLKGYSVPLSPLGRANLTPPPPWHYSSDVVAAEFWVNREAAQASLPPKVTIDGAAEARAVLMFLDWQFTASNDEMLDPARYQYREAFLLLDAHFGDMPIAYCPFIFVDNDAAVMRGFTQDRQPEDAVAALLAQRRHDLAGDRCAPVRAQRLFGGDPPVVVRLGHPDPRSPGKR
jgi:acetoacetate decarboxylase